MLYDTEFTGNQLAQLRTAYAGTEQSNPPFKLRFHGVTKPKRALAPIDVTEMFDKEIITNAEYEQYNIECDPGRRPAPASADMEQQTGHTRGFVGIVQPDHRALQTDYERTRTHG
jgi:hypothetical protein